jgi:hypothetical protein
MLLFTKNNAPRKQPVEKNKQSPPKDGTFEANARGSSKGITFMDLGPYALRLAP